MTAAIARRLSSGRPFSRRHCWVCAWGIRSLQTSTARTCYGRELIANFMDVCAGISAAGSRNAAGAGEAAGQGAGEGVGACAGAGEGVRGREAADAEWMRLSEGAAKRAAEKEVLYA